MKEQGITNTNNGGIQMMKKFKKQMKNEKGLTLIELLAVIVILAIVAAIAIPAIGNIITNSKVNALKADGQNILVAAQLYFVENPGEDDVDSSDLLSEGYLEDEGGFSATNGVEASVEKKPNGANEITGTAANGTTTVEFIKATNADITAAGVKDSTDETYANVEITR